MMLSGTGMKPEARLLPVVLPNITCSLFTITTVHRYQMTNLRSLLFPIDGTKPLAHPFRSMGMKRGVLCQLNMPG